ncbi:urease accessory protein UreF [Sphingobium jiangsuense]|uniref:Urease accessory protein UreF n=1 Tax=Sphingobium jiangsuense TaxID=870476 RepID=A0A7W6BFN1_9SPHN|nr:urease accessory protein UreF [Sphingobium jiangsuense]MBB3926028.1 urease accessory protein [Sphingobium jiangsuense]GLT02570.1 urease accessory protein UreF [Sphingobium jiangsuense]
MTTPPRRGNITTTTTTMLTDAALQPLLAWTSPAYPIGAFTYSHGLETAVDDGRVRTAADIVAYVETVLSSGGGWVDAVLFAHGWRAAGDEAAFDELADLAAAFRGSSETLLESVQQGRSFLAVTRAAWPHPALDAFAARRADLPVAHCSVMALACAAHGLPLAPSLHACIHGMAANLVSAGVRLVPLGQTDGQIATAALSRLIPALADRALATSLDDLGTASPLLELASFHHETLYTRLFRS